MYNGIHVGITALLDFIFQNLARAEVQLEPLCLGPDLVENYFMLIIIVFVQFESNNTMLT